MSTTNGQCDYKSAISMYSVVKYRKNRVIDFNNIQGVDVLRDSSRHMKEMQSETLLSQNDCKFVKIVIMKYYYINIIIL